MKTTTNRKQNGIGLRWQLGLIALFGLLVASEAMASARITMASGKVERGHGDPTRWEPVRAGDPLGAGEAVRTGADGRVELSWLGSTLRLYGDSLLRLPADADADGVEMDAGTGLFDVERRPGRAFEVHTPEIVVSVKGTRFGVDLVGDDPGVAVYRGAVGVRSLALSAAEEVMVREGFRAMGNGAELPELFLLREDDPWDAFGPEARSPRISAIEAMPRDALDDARRAIVHTYRGEVLRRATQADPALARRLAAVGDARLAVRGERPAAPDPDAMVRSIDRTRETDPLLDGGIAELRNALREEFIEAWVNGEVTSAGTGDASGSFEINLISGSGTSGGDRVRIDETQLAQFWEFTENDLANVIDGTAAFPAELQNVLSVSGVNDPAQFATLLLVMLENR